MKNKKICCILIPSLQGNGAERFSLNLYEALTYYENFECHIIYIKNVIELEVNDNVSLHYIPLLTSGSLKSKVFKRRQQASIIEAYIINNIGQPDLVLSNLTLMDKIAKHLTFEKIYHIVHSTTSIEHTKNRRGFKKWLATLKIKNIYGRHDRVCVSQGVLEDLKENFKLKGKSNVIYNPINLDELLNKKEEKIDTPPYEYLIHIGKFNAAKRHDRLIYAYSASGIKTKLVLVGKGGCENKIKELVTSLNLENQVIFAGFKSNPYPLLSKAKGLVLSSDYEGLPTVILEALALGIPAISTDCPSGPNEILPEHSLCELDVDSLSEKIIQLDTNPLNFVIPLRDEFTMKFAASQYAKLNKN